MNIFTVHCYTCLTKYREAAPRTPVRCGRCGSASKIVAVTVNKDRFVIGAGPKR